jgi:hypothetical protein
LPEKEPETAFLLFPAPFSMFKNPLYYAIFSLSQKQAAYKKVYFFVSCFFLSASIILPHLK